MPQYVKSPPLIFNGGNPIKPGTVFQYLDIEYVPGSGVDPSYGFYTNGQSNFKLLNCRIHGFKNNVALTGGTTNVEIGFCDIAHATGTAADVFHMQGLYTEGLKGSYIHDNLIYHNGWWDTYDPTDPNQRAWANGSHQIYGNQSNGFDDSNQCINNICIDGPGSQIGWRAGGVITGNVTRAGGDRSIIVGGSGNGTNAIMTGNLDFGPLSNSQAYYGGGMQVFCPNFLAAPNYFSGSAAITNNPACIDGKSNLIPGQLGIWPKPGASVLATPGQPVMQLEQFYGAKDTATMYGMMSPGDAPRIIAWWRSAQH